VKKLYIDIDGVLLKSGRNKLAPGALELIDVATKNFDCYWLSSYCKGDATHFVRKAKGKGQRAKENAETGSVISERPEAGVLRFLSDYVNESTLEKMKKIKATNWLSWKTEGIDLESDFVWLEDHPMRAEMQVLKEHGKLDRLIVVDLDRKDELIRIVEDLSHLSFEARRA
jgi:hypothetical protein